VAEVVPNQPIEDFELLALAGEVRGADPLDVADADEDVGERADREQRRRRVERDRRPRKSDQADDQREEDGPEDGPARDADGVGRCEARPIEETAGDDERQREDAAEDDQRPARQREGRAAGRDADREPESERASDDVVFSDSSIRVALSLAW
jgi:hypothetical protein